MRSRLLFALCFPVCLFGACAGSRSKPAPQPAAPPPAAEPAAGQGQPTKAPEKPAPRSEPAPTTKDKAASRPSAPAGAPSPAQQTGKAAAPAAPGEKAAEPSAGSAQPPEDGRSAREHVLEAMKLLDKGDPEGAWVELNAAVRIEPGNESATLLMKQMDIDPEEALGKEYFSYTTERGDTLSKIAKRFLNDDRKFYILARYNGIRVPRDLSAGQVLKIPGKRPAGVPKPAPAPPPKEPATAPAPPPPPVPAKAPVKEGAPVKSAEPETSADKLYQGGVQAVAAGAPDKAYELLTQALKANPKHAGAQEKLREIRTAAVDAYYKKAMASFSRQDLDETIRYCNKALEIDPDSEKVKLKRAQAQDLQEKLRKR